MSKVYVVWQDSHEYPQIWGVFSTSELAQKCVKDRMGDLMEFEVDEFPFREDGKDMWRVYLSAALVPQQVVRLGNDYKEGVEFLGNRYAGGLRGGWCVDLLARDMEEAEGLAVVKVKEIV